MWVRQTFPHFLHSTPRRPFSVGSFNVSGRLLRTAAIHYRPRSRVTGRALAPDPGSAGLSPPAPGQEISSPRHRSMDQAGPHGAVASRWPLQATDYAAPGHVVHIGRKARVVRAHDPRAGTPAPRHATGTDAAEPGGPSTDSLNGDQIDEADQAWPGVAGRGVARRGRAWRGEARLGEAFFWVLL